MRRARRLVVVAAHPDDETIGAGGLLVRGGAAAVVHLTDGAPRDRRWWPNAWTVPVPADAAAYAALRRAELEAALAVAGLRPEAARWLDAADQEAALQLAPLSLRLAEVLAEVRPAVVVTHAYEGGHPDHDAAAFAVRAAAELLARRGIAAPRLCEMTSYHAAGEAVATGVFLPADAAPARELRWALPPPVRAAKARMLAAHASQRPLLAEFGFGTDAERFRRALPVDFGAAPHRGPLWYERMGFTMTGTRFRELARRASVELGLAR